MRTSNSHITRGDNQLVSIRFYEELNDFLPADRRKQTFQIGFELPRSVKDLIESLGVPHVEVDLIIVNGESVPFDRLVVDGDSISVYPMFESFDIGNITRLRPKPLRTPRFVLDVHLRTLTRKLRMLGFDSWYTNDADDDELARVSATENRTLLTRDLGLLKRSEVRRGLFVRATDPAEQIIEIGRRLDLTGDIEPFSRCIRCNGHIVSTDLNVPDAVRAGFDTFHACDSCGRIYWRGTHYTRMLEEIELIKTKISRAG